MKTTEIAGRKNRERRLVKSREEKFGNEDFSNHRRKFQGKLGTEMIEITGRKIQEQRQTKSREENFGETRNKLIR